MEERTPSISFENATILGGDSPVIYGMNLEIFPGDFMYIVGKVGTGKTSILRTIMAENRPADGCVKACGYDRHGKDIYSQDDNGRKQACRRLREGLRL